MTLDSAPRHRDSRGRVADAVRARIIAGEFAPAENISEIAVATEYGVSRTPVREAFKQLQSEGLIEIRPRVGTFVRVPTRREILELFEMKGLLEGAAARLFALRGRIRELDRLEANVAESDAVTASGDVERYARLVEEFHSLLVAGADNGKLAAHYRLLMNQLAYSRLVTTSLSRPGRALKSGGEHHRVLELIQAKDGEGAERVMREHVTASRRAVLAGLDAMEAGAGEDAENVEEPQPRA